MKKRHIVPALAGLALSCHLILTGCQSQSNQSNSKEKLNISHESAKDSIVVVSEIFEDGYMQQLGEDTFYVKGQIPYTAKFLDSLLPPNGYVFDKNQVMYQVDKGYIIRIGKTFYYYTSEKGGKGGLINLKEAKKLTKGRQKTTADETKKKQVSGIDKPTDDGFLLKDSSQITIKNKM